MRSPAYAVIAAAGTWALVAVTGVDAQNPGGLLRSVEKGCTIETRAMVFGDYDPTSASHHDGVSEVIYTCGDKSDQGDQGAIKNIRIELSRGNSGSFQRAMSGGSERLEYNLYLDSTRSVIWGDGTGGTQYYFDPHPPNKKPVPVTVYGRVFSAQDVSVGQYADNLQVTIQF